MEYAVILAGGWGERLWPMSTRRRPKQLLRLGSGSTLVGETVARVAPLVDIGKSLVLTNAALRERVVPELRGVRRERVIGEPFGRNTAPAVALAAHLLVGDDRDAVMVVLPADHLIEGDEPFRAAIRLAAEAARATRSLVTLGVRPTRPETEYGYIRVGRASGPDGVFEVEEFVEKPDRTTAESYLVDGNYLWNSGMFVWRADRFLEEIARHLPDVASALADVGSRPGDAAFPDELLSFYERVPSISVDYGIMEKADGILVVPAAFRWDDVGAWSALARVWPADDKGNAVSGDAVLVDAERCVVWAEDGVVAVLGLSDVVVARAGGATLVCPLGRARDVRAIVEELKRRGYLEGA